MRTKLAAGDSSGFRPLRNGFSALYIAAADMLPFTAVVVTASY